MKMLPEHDRVIRAALDATVEAARKAAETTTTDDAAKALRALWHATHAAMDAVTEGDRATREAALANTRKAA